MEWYVIGGALTVGVLVLIYFIPVAVAYYRGHSSLTGIILLNVFLGWTFLGWVGALVWSSVGGKTETKIAPPQQNNNDDRVQCSECAELIMPSARKCRFCGADQPLRVE